MKVTEIVSTNYTLEIPILKPQTNVKSPNFQFQQSMSHDYKWIPNSPFLKKDKKKRDVEKEFCDFPSFAHYF